MKANQIKSLLVLNGVSQATIARKMRVSHEAISATIKGRIKSRRLRTAIAKAIGRSYNDVWSEKAEDRAA